MRPATPRSANRRRWRAAASVGEPTDRVPDRGTGPRADERDNGPVKETAHAKGPGTRPATLLPRQPATPAGPAPCRSRSWCRTATSREPVRRPRPRRARGLDPAQGVIQPIVVTPLTSELTIVAGERRWRAAQRAGLAEVPVVVRRLEEDRQQLELALVENLQRADLNALEEAEAYRLLAETFGLAQDRIAERVGRARAITNSSGCCGCRPRCRTWCARARSRRPGAPAARARRPGRIGLAEARGPTDSRRGARGARFRRRQAEAPRARGGRPESTPPPRPKRLTRALQTRSKSAARAGGAIRLRFHSEEELMRLTSSCSGGPSGLPGLSVHRRGGRVARS